MPAIPQPKGKAKDIADALLGKKTKTRTRKLSIDESSQEATEKNIRQRYEIEDGWRNR